MTEKTEKLRSTSIRQLEAQGVEFSRIPADSRGITDPKDILPLIRPNTRLVAIMHASNVCGTLLPVKEISDICRERGLPVILDAAQTAGHYPVNMKELGLSALCVPGHKGLLGPQGIGVRKAGRAADIRRHRQRIGQRAASALYARQVRIRHPEYPRHIRAQRGAPLHT